MEPQRFGAAQGPWGIPSLEEPPLCRSGMKPSEGVDLGCLSNLQVPGSTAYSFAGGGGDPLDLHFHTFPW